MELRQLRYFIRIVELGSITSAAKDLYIAQPALSVQIAKLEDELGVKLLARSVRGVTATKAGESLYLHAQAILRHVERVRLDLGSMGSSPAGPVSIGMPTSAANILAGPLISYVQEHYPDIQLRIVESLSGHLKELAINGRLEMSLLFEPEVSLDTSATNETVGGSGLSWIPLLQEELFLLSKPECPVMDAVPISLKEACSRRLVLPGQANLTRQLIEEVFKSAGFKLHVAAEIDSLSTIQSIVESGHACTILSLSAIVGENKSMRLSARPIEGGVMRRRLSLCISDVVGLGMAAECIAEAIPELVRKFVQSGQWEGASIIDPCHT